MSKQPPSLDNGVWFLSADAGVDPETNRRWVLVCAVKHPKLGRSGMIFHEVVEGHRGSLELRVQAIRWFTECYKWLNSNVQHLKDGSGAREEERAAPEPPRAFSVAAAKQPGRVTYFASPDMANNPPGSHIENTKTFAHLLTSAWPEWHVWRVTAGAPAHPSLQHATVSSPSGEGETPLTPED